MKKDLASIEEMNIRHGFLPAGWWYRSLRLFHLGGWWFQIYFLFLTRKLGKVHKNDEHIFQRGCNHQLDILEMNIENQSCNSLQLGMYVDKCETKGLLIACVYHWMLFVLIFHMQIMFNRHRLYVFTPVSWAFATVFGQLVTWNCSSLGEIFCLKCNERNNFSKLIYSFYSCIAKCRDSKKHDKRAISPAIRSTPPKTNITLENPNFQ